MFLSIEDENFGIANVVVMPDMFAERRVLGHQT